MNAYVLNTREDIGARWWRSRPQLSSETLILLSSLLFTIFCNRLFWHDAFATSGGSWRLGVALFVFVTASQAFLLGLLAFRWNAKALLTLLFIVTAFATHYMNAYGVYLDPDMLRNILHTENKESRELITFGLVMPLLIYGALPIALLWRVDIRKRSAGRAAMTRLVFLLASLLAAGGGAMLASQDIAALARNNRDLRYLITPSNYLTSLARVLLASPPGPRTALIPVAEDATLAVRPAGGKPRLLVLVLGETARGHNWGLNGYERQTTPELAAMPDVINFTDMTSCGTSTEVSVPCMFSPFGRHDYNEKNIRQHQSLLHVLDRVGIQTLWRDNQTGCKGVCDDLPIERLDDAKDPVACAGERCLDEILLKDLRARLGMNGRDKIVVLHQLGNHGPSYFLRYPPEFRRFTPTCDTGELGKCTQQQIVNAYDNALLYTDHFLARTIGFLKQQTEYDTAMIYVSDHGESLGEKGLFLHGVPYAIAPKEQVHVPMLMWFSPEFAASRKLDTACLRARSRQPAGHDNLFPSVLGLMQVRTAAYDKDRDLFAGCEAAH